MQAVKKNNKTLPKARVTATPGPLERFMGEEARIESGKDVQINNNISASCLEVFYPEHKLPEERGMLYLFPVEENRFCIQLCYIVFGSGQNHNVCSFTFAPAFFDQFPITAVLAEKPFSAGKSIELEFSICNKTAALLTEIRQFDTFSPLSRLLHQSQLAISLLNRALESIAVPFSACQVPACRFLAFESERIKIQEACQHIAAQEGRPFTIRELARKVAMNECYLKKGFKAITGKTIHEYQQELRIGKAKELLEVHKLSVTDVSVTLGYSSISHFSTAFKRVTGMKPCELLA